MGAEAGPVLVVEEHGREICGVLEADTGSPPIRRPRSDYLRRAVARARHACLPLSRAANTVFLSIKDFASLSSTVSVPAKDRSRGAFRTFSTLGLAAAILVSTATYFSALSQYPTADQVL